MERGSRNLENQIAQSVMEQEKGFVDFSAGSAELGSLLGWSRGRDPTKAPALAWGDQVGIC